MELSEFNLNDNQRAFIKYFVEQGCKNAGKAYLKAYPNSTIESGRISAYNLLKKDEVKKAVRNEVETLLGAHKLTLEKELFDYYYIRAFFDPTEIIGLNGELLITEDELRNKNLILCIDSINRKYTNSGESYMEYKLADRDKAAEQLSKYIQMIKNGPNVNVNFDAGNSGEMTPQEEALYQAQLKAIRGEK